MLKHYLTTSLAHIGRAPIATAASALMLAFGLLAFVTAYAVTGFWARSERHFANVERIYSVSTDLQFRDGSVTTGELPLTNEHVAAYVATDFPSLGPVARARVISDAAMVSSDERAVRMFRVAVDPEFLEIFDLPFVAGDPATALRTARSIVLTERGAERLFGAENPLGRRVRLSNSVDATVTGVIAAIPEPSHMGRSASALLRFDLLSSYDSAEPSAHENWLLLDTTTYVLLPDDGSLSAGDLRRGLETFAARHVPPEQLAFARLAFDIVPVTELLVRAGSSRVFLSRTGISVVSMLLLLGAVVLVVACINYANLATARAVDHVRDVGIRKFLGARPRHIAAQYLLDAGLVTGAGALVALVLIALLVPVFAATSGIDLRIALLDGAQSLEFFILLLVIVTLAAGAYPALVLSRLRPVWALRAGNASLGSRLFSTALVGVQFAIASLLSIAAVVTYLQNQELRRTGLQATQDPHVIIENFYTATHLNPDTLRAELLRFPQVLSVSSMAKPPWTGVNVLPLSRSPDESLSQRSAVWYTVGHDFFSTAGMRLLAGRSFLPEHGDDALSFLQDPQRPNSIVIDRALMEELGFRSPEEPVGELIYVPTGLMAGFGGSAAQPLRIVGVVENKPLTIAGIGPRGAVYSFADPLPFLIVRIERADVTGALEGIDATWRRLVPNVALRRRFADDIFNESYASFARINRTFSALALFAVLICAIGLFAMATQVTSRRRREIAIRKTLGASTRQIVLLLLRSFAVPIIAANIVAWPVAYNAARAYLGAFVAPIALTPTPFVLCLLSTLLIVAVAVGGQTLRAARLRPSVTPL